MTHRTLVAALLLCSCSFFCVHAQPPASALPGLIACQDRNGQSDLVEGLVTFTGPGGNMGFPSEVAVRVVPTRTLALEGVEVVIGSAFLGPVGIPFFGVFQLYSENAGSGLPGSVIAVADGAIASGPFLPNGLAWTGSTFSQPPMLVAGTPYWVSFSDLAGLGVTLGTQNVSGPDATPLTSGGPLSGGPWAPVQFTERAKLRLLATTCPAPSNAAVSIVGAACPAGSGPALLTSGLPITGNGNFGFLVNGTLPNLPAALFWAPTADPVGTTVASMGCRLHLDQQGMLGLLSAGLNPLQVGQTGLTGVATFPFPIPNDPSLDGFSAAFQGLLVDPNGAPTETPGISIALTPAVVATIGL